jgi:hypothetical protein
MSFSPSFRRRCTISMISAASQRLAVPASMAAPNSSIVLPQIDLSRISLLRAIASADFAFQGTLCDPSRRTSCVPSTCTPRNEAMPSPRRGGLSCEFDPCIEIPLSV